MPMGKIYLHIANANHIFNDTDCFIFRQAAKKAEVFISEMFQQFNYNVDMVVITPSFLLPTITEDGIAGRTHNSRLIMLSVNKHQHQINEDFVFETICHELAHSLRWEKVPEYAETMFDGMILEGLAVVLEEEAMNRFKQYNKQFFLRKIQNTKQKEVDAMIAALKNNFNNTAYDYNAIFYTGNDNLPRWTGYKLGYYFVKQYLLKTNQTIAQATFASYRDFTPNIEKFPS